MLGARDTEVRRRWEKVTPKQIPDQCAPCDAGGSQRIRCECKEEHASAEECLDAFAFPRLL